MSQESNDKLQMELWSCTKRSQPLNLQSLFQSETLRSGRLQDLGRLLGGAGQLSQFNGTLHGQQFSTPTGSLLNHSLMMSQQFRVPNAFQRITQQASYGTMETSPFIRQTSNESFPTSISEISDSPNMKSSSTPKTTSSTLFARIFSKLRSFVSILKPSPGTSTAWGLLVIYRSR